MAKLAVVAIRDSALDAFQRPFTVPSLGVASRSFADEVNRREGEMFKHPEDYELFHVADFDDLTGRFFPLADVQLVIRGKDCVQK